MAVYRIEEPNKAVKYVKEIDEHNCKLTFTTSKSQAYSRGDGIVGNSVGQYLKFHFMEDYPELEYMTVESSW